MPESTESRTSTLDLDSGASGSCCLQASQLDAVGSGPPCPPPHGFLPLLLILHLSVFLKSQIALSLTPGLPPGKRCLTQDRQPWTHTVPFGGPADAPDSKPPTDKVTTVATDGLLSDPDVGAEGTLKEWYWEGGVCPIR